MSPVLFVCLSLMMTGVIVRVNTAAIPIWEFLNHDEKMSYVYTNFVTQVESYCQSLDVKNCEKDLVVYGLKKMHSMTEDQLDEMDPFERDAPQKIWDSMMDGHQFAKKPQHDKKPDKNAHKKAQDRVESGDYIPEAPVLEPETSQLPEMDQAEKPKPTIHDVSNHLNPSASNKHEIVESATKNFNHVIEGPMTVRVRVDGTLVDRREPVDEDLIYTNMARIQVPSISSINKFYDSTPLSALFGSHPYAAVVRPQ